MKFFYMVGDKVRLKKGHDTTTYTVKHVSSVTHHDRGVEREGEPNYVLHSNDGQSVTKMTVSESQIELVEDGSEANYLFEVGDKVRLRGSATAAILTVMSRRNNDLYSEPRYVIGTEDDPAAVRVLESDLEPVTAAELRVVDLEGELRKLRSELRQLSVDTSVANAEGPSFTIPNPYRVTAAHEAARIIISSFAAFAQVTGGGLGWKDWADDVTKLASWFLAEGEDTK